KSRSPLPAADVNDMMEDCKEMGLLLGKAGLHSNVLRIKPPMCITLSDADFAIDVIEKSIKNHYDRTKTQSYKMRQNVTVETVPMFTP
ncbi:alanine--glyoxylate aminotransferase 2, mitochondrial-like, partial [Saccoglossus kowalevskii]|uniref:Alanine--glyoxylate aminotransferase 2, mitochondrial-like n=1 Tax=Saccoglossus kowalevskii TaxID=10224 RepID=A0ABM0M5T6_SACKO